MSVELNHHIVHAHDPVAAAADLADLLGLPAPRTFGPFTVLDTANGVSLDFIAGEGAFESNHYAFLVTDEEFDEVFGRITARGIPYFADPGGHEEGEINHHFGGRGLYWRSPDGHWLEIITRPYGAWDEI